MAPSPTSRGPALYLVRHAKAGSRKDWDGDDDLRPLSKAGGRQAAALATSLMRHGPTVLISSPLVRCVQTLEPLAHMMRNAVRTDERLAEGSDFADVFELSAALPDGAVMCSHGDVIPAVISALERRGCTIDTPAQWGKASTWVLQRDTEGRFLSASALPPPHT